VKLVPEILRQIQTSSKTIYRGHANADWELKPSIGRYFTGDWETVSEREQRALEDFKRLSVPYIKHRPESDVEWLCLMQHYGCATRLLDFTSNPLIAIFFASELSQETDGALFIAQYKRSYATVLDSKLFSQPANFAYHPSHITERIIGQSGCFVYSCNPNRPLNRTQIKVIPIPKRHKPQLRGELASLGISHSSLFPGLDGICRDLNDTLVNDLEIEEILS